MRTPFLVLSLILTCGRSGETCAADIDAAGGLTIQVRTHDAARLDPDIRRRAVAVATLILETAGLRIAWIDCDLAGSQALDRCQVPLTPSEVTVRFVRLAPEAGGNGVTLGSSFVDTQARTGTLATIYVNRVDSLARRTEADTAVLLGRTVAHEVGHLLFGSTAHAETGLMKAVWSREVLQRNHASDWVFTASEALALRDAVRERTRAAAALPLLAARRSED
jgi:hypothetical protein